MRLLGQQVVARRDSRVMAFLLQKSAVNNG